MNANEIIKLFGLPIDENRIESLFTELNTLNRPALPDDDKFVYHDWVLVRRKGIELGFTDSEYQAAADKFRWRYGKLLLTQVYFYAGFDDVQPYAGELPFRLIFSDNKETARAKLAGFEGTRHSYINDTWDVDRYRLTVTYTKDGQSIDRIACRVMASPIPRSQSLTKPSMESLARTYGASIHSPEFKALWGDILDAETLQESIEDGEIDFTQNYGVTVGLAKSSGSPPVFRSITLHRNRDSESVGWLGEMPLGLNFDDSPEILFQKIKSKPLQQADSALTGHSVWNFKDCTLHVLYSNIDNRILRIKLMAPGTWKSVEEV